MGIVIYVPVIFKVGPQLVFLISVHHGMLFPCYESSESQSEQIRSINFSDVSMTRVEIEMTFTIYQLTTITPT